MSRVAVGAHSAVRLVLGVIVAGTPFVHASTARGLADPEQICQQGRYRAAAKYADCQQRALAKVFGGEILLLGGAPYLEFERTCSRCRAKYTGIWARLQARASGTGTTCDNARFDATSAPGTVIDRLTGLQWERKTDDGTVHDKDNCSYTWSIVSPAATAANGTAFTMLLATLNGGECFVGQCDWRLPTIAELQTIVLEPYLCVTIPCIDQAVFGPTAAITYWSGTPHATLADVAWGVGFFNGDVGYNSKDVEYCVRAVRGGL